MFSAELRLGGFRVGLGSAARRAPYLPDYAPFSSSCPEADSGGAQVDFVAGWPPSAWRDGDCVISTGTTWALARTGDAAWPYLFSPAIDAARQPPLYHAAVSADFAKLRVYLEDAAPKRFNAERFYPLDELFTRLFLSQRGGVLLHAAGVVDAGSHLFLGDSGAGKSTIAELHERTLGPGRILSDDRVIVRKEGACWYAYGSPWHGTFPRALAGGVPLRGLYFLRQTPHHELRRLSATEALLNLLPVALGPIWLPEAAADYLGVVSELAHDPAVPKAVLGFAPDLSIVAWLKRHSCEPIPISPPA